MHHKAFKFGDFNILKHTFFYANQHINMTYIKKLKIVQKLFCAQRVPFLTNLPDTFEQYAKINCIKSLVNSQH